MTMRSPTTMITKFNVKLKSISRQSISSHDQFYNEWVSGGCLTSIQQLFRYIMVRTSYFLKWPFWMKHVKHFNEIKLILWSMSTYLAEYHERCFYVYFLLILQSQRNHLNKLVSHAAVSEEKKTLFVHIT